MNKGSGSGSGIFPDPDPDPGDQKRPDPQHMVHPLQIKHQAGSDNLPVQGADSHLHYSSVYSWAAATLREAVQRH